MLQLSEIHCKCYLMLLVIHSRWRQTETNMCHVYIVLYYHPLFFSLVLSAMHPVRKNMMNMANTGNAEHWTCSNRGGSMTSFHPQNSPTGGNVTSIQPLRLAYYSIRNMQVQHIHILKEAPCPENNRKNKPYIEFSIITGLYFQKLKSTSSFNDLNGKNTSTQYLKGAIFSWSPPINQPARTHRS